MRSNKIIREETRIKHSLLQSSARDDQMENMRKEEKGKKRKKKKEKKVNDLLEALSCTN
jgi:hypothetical protein